MDSTLLGLVSIIVSLTNQVQALQQENAALRSKMPAEEPTPIRPTEGAVER